MLYFSGLAGKAEIEMLTTAGVKHVLVDPADASRLKDEFVHIALDSGAYAAWKKNVDLDIPRYLQIASGTDYEFHVAPDVIGDPESSRANWLEYRQTGMVPVWHWGSETALLDAYLDESPIVAIGALVSLMREKDEKMLKALTRLCEQHPARFHLLGANWLKAINQLNDIVFSMDTSKFLDAARYGHLIFIHTKTGKLHQAPAKCLGMADLSRFERCVESAKAMNLWCNNVAA